MPNVGIAGARANAEIKRILEAHGVNIAFDITCTNASRRFVPQKGGHPCPVRAGRAHAASLRAHAGHIPAQSLLRPRPSPDRWAGLSHCAVLRHVLLRVQRPQTDITRADTRARDRLHRAKPRANAHAPRGIPGIDGRLANRTSRKPERLSHEQNRNLCRREPIRNRLPPTPSP